MSRIPDLPARVRAVVAAVVAVALITPIALMWNASRVPGTYSVMDMGYADYGGGAAVPHTHHGVSVASLTGPHRGTPAVAVTLVARKESFRLASGERVSGYTLNHASPGPAISARQGDPVEVTLVNESVPAGVTLHWHGVDVPNAEDGVAGVTQDAVQRGERHVYRFMARDAGSYWYHSHQVSHAQVRGGLFGLLVVSPRGASTGAVEVPAVMHVYGGRVTVNGRTGLQHVDVAGGAVARVRVVNTDSGPLRVWVAGSSYRVAAIDGRDLRGPTDVRDRVLTVAAGGRADLLVAAPTDGSAARVELGGGPALLAIGPPGSAPVARVPTPRRELDLLSYGTPAPVGFDVSAATRSFDYRIGRRPGFVDGRPGFWWTINGHLFPDVPMYVVAEGDVVRMRIKNTSGQVHPMHLHGHHAVVVSRNGVRSTGSPWWVDSLNVRSGETYVIAFRADNPGVWMDHCHNLPHAQQGLVAHLAYVGVTVPFRVGDPAHNAPE